MNAGDRQAWRGVTVSVQGHSGVAAVEDTSAGLGHTHELELMHF